ELSIIRKTSIVQFDPAQIDGGLALDYENLVLSNLDNSLDLQNQIMLLRCTPQVSKDLRVSNFSKHDTLDRQLQIFTTLISTCYQSIFDCNITTYNIEVNKCTTREKGTKYATQIRVLLTGKVLLDIIDDVSITWLENFRKDECIEDIDIEENIEQKNEELDEEDELEKNKELDEEDELDEKDELEKKDELKKEDELEEEDKMEEEDELEEKDELEEEDELEEKNELVDESESNEKISFESEEDFNNTEFNNLSNNIIKGLQLLYIKDKHTISNQAFNEILEIFNISNISLYRLQKF
ncbi:41214_t:CDS:2, partial [Gigaspora margarita]